MGIRSQSYLKIAIVFFSIFQLTQALESKVTLVLYSNSPDTNETYTYDNAGEICSSPYFNASRLSCMMVHPWSSNLTNEGPAMFNNEMMKRDVNTFGIDWNKLDSLLDLSIGPIVVINQLTKALINMKACLRPALLQMVGISMGAQIACRAAKNFGTYVGEQVLQLIGFDPSPPNLFPTCDSSCSMESLMIHTDKYVYGNCNPLGKIDVWFNDDTYENTHCQPGCTDPDLVPTFRTEKLCSHKKAVLYYTIALQNNATCLFMCTKAANTRDWVRGNGTGVDVICLGQPINPAFSGNYYCSTSETYPYGLGAAGMRAVTSP